MKLLRNSNESLNDLCTILKSRFVAALIGLRHIMPLLRYGKTLLAPGTIYVKACGYFKEARATWLR